MSVVYLPHPDWIYLFLTGGEQGRASEKGSCVHKSGASESGQRLVFYTDSSLVLGAGGALEESPGHQVHAVIQYLDRK